MGPSLAPSSIVGVVPGRFVGRLEDLGTVSDLLRTHQVVTVVGPPGVGKTRLSAEVARSVGFTPGAEGPVAVSLVEGPARDALDLVILDGCERSLPHAREQIHGLLASNERVRVLVTSRLPLGIEDEVIVRLCPLECPPSSATAPGEIAGFEAVELFVDRARGTVPTFELTDENASAVADICRAVDGVPLALELAATHLALLAPASIAESLAKRTSVAVSGDVRIGHHRSLDQAIAWSYVHLGELEQVLLRRLCVFDGGFEASAAEEVCSGRDLGFDQVRPALARLVHSSFVVTDEDEPEPRFRLLNMVRTFGEDRLVEAGEEEEGRARHGQWAKELASEAEANLTGPAQAHWLRRIDSEIQNLRAARDWYLRSRNSHALAIVTALSLYWRMRGLCGEGLEWFTAVTKLRSVPEALQAKAHWGAGLMLHMQGHHKSAERSLVRGVELARSENDSRLVARAMLVLAACHMEREQEGSPCLQECLYLANEVSDDWTLSHALVLASVEQLRIGEPDQARDLCEQAVAVARRCGDPQGLAYCLISMAGITARSDVSRTQEALAEALGIAVSEALEFEQAYALMRLSALDLSVGRLVGADAHLAAAQPLCEALGGKPLFEVQYIRARLLQARGDPQAARVLLDDLRTRRPADVAVLRASAQVALALGHSAAAADFAEAAVAGARAADSGLAPCLLTRAEWSRSRGEFAPAMADVQEVLDLCRDTRHSDVAADALDAAAGLALANETGVHAARHAARLFGAAEALRRSVGITRFPPDDPRYAGHVASMTGRLEMADLDAAWAAGEAMTAADAVELARRGPGAHGPDERDDPWESLTSREREVIDLLAEGLSYKEMAERLYVSPRAVKARFTRVFDKTGLRSREALTREADIRRRRHPERHRAT